MKKTDNFYDLRAVHILLQQSPAVMEPILRQSPNLFELWMLPLFLYILILLGYVRVSYSRRLHRLFSSLIRLQIFRQIMREELVFSHRVSLLLFLNFGLVLALIFYTASRFYGWYTGGYSGWEAFLVIVGIIAGGYLLKLLINFILRKLYRDPGLLREYIFEVVLINKVLGILLLPVVLALVFVNVSQLHGLFIAAGIILCLFLVYRILRGIIMSMSYSVSWVYIILYLCTLEILPFLVLYKIFTAEIT